MKPKIPIQAQQQILKLKTQVLNLKQRIARMQEKHKLEIAQLKAENQSLHDNPIVCTEEQRARLLAMREKLTAGA